MLRWRLAAAAAILIPLVALFVADFHWNGGAPGIWLVVPGLAIGLMAAAEVLDLVRTRGSRPLGWTVYCGTSLIFLAACVPMAWGLAGGVYPRDCPMGQHGWVLTAAAIAVGLAFFGEMRRFNAPDGVVVNLALSVLIVAYVGIPLSFAVALRRFQDNAWGMAALVSVIFVVKLSDTGAYFAGKSFGRRKLAPRLSPGKTIAGGVGGLIAAMVASGVFLHCIAPWIVGDVNAVGGWIGAAAYGFVLGAVGLLGDLSESLIKRDVQRKESSSWLPGLGGVLDVLDSLLFAMPAGYVCWSLGIVGGS